MKRLILATVVVLASAVPALAQSAVFVVRHAERADAGTASGGMMASDPDLSEAGRARAQSLVALLKDARITAIFATELKRTQQTAEPLARALGLQVTRVRANDTEALVRQIAAAKGNVLVVGHSNTVPALIQKLGVTEPVTIGDADYDNLFVVWMGKPPSLVRLHLPSPAR